jgi:uncharacterized cupin superfamily protein
MATVLKGKQREFKEDPKKTDPYRLLSDVSRSLKGVKPQNLNFDVRLLNPGQYSAPYHFHRFAEELFMVISGSMTLRSNEGLEKVTCGDLIFFEMGETGAHQFFNHTAEPCTYLDIRTYIGYDVCEYPDSDKILLAPSYEIFAKKAQLHYFDGEHDIVEKWKQLPRKSE